VKPHRAKYLSVQTERVNSRVKGLLGMNRITEKGIAKVTVRSAFSLLIMLGTAVSMAQYHKYDTIRSLLPDY